MKVLVIGSSGFIGQALVARLLAEGHEVEAWDRREGEARPGPA
jgi:nucleoside-diphosphate-sugar epimerase